MFCLFLFCTCSVFEIQADLQRIKTLTGVVTQGKDSMEGTQWTTKYTVSYSLNCINWNLVKEGGGIKVRSF